MIDRIQTTRMVVCSICKRLLDDPNDLTLSADCGGDCNACMFMIEHLFHHDGIIPDDELRSLMLNYYQAAAGLGWEGQQHDLPLNELKAWINERLGQR